MTPFEDLHSYIAIPRVTGLRLSPDGTWLAATVQQPDPDGKKYSTSIWRIPAGGGAPALRRARPADPVGAGRGRPGVPSRRLPAVRLPAARPGGRVRGRQGGEQDGAKPALWLLPAAGGDARRIAAPPGGASRIVTARGARGLMFTSPLLPGRPG